MIENQSSWGDKMKFLLLVLFVSVNAMAVEINFIGPCDKKPLLSGSMGNKYETVGDTTVQFLTKNNVAYNGNARGINQVFNTPVGDAALEVISDTEMRAYGWCYFVDNMGPDVFADEYPMDNTIKKIDWIYGFAHYKNGAWISNCTPAFTIKPKFICKK
jgi:hypothetical protein